MKQTKHFLLMATMLLCSLATSAHDFEVEGVYYNIISDTEAEITFKGDDSYQGGWYSGSITIPATVTYDGVEYSVTSIGDYAFRDCSHLTTINIPEGVTSIGYQTFSGCSSLTAINIPEGVTSIGNGAFQYCSGLTSISIPKGVTSIGDSAFSWCSSLTAITLPEGVTSIGYDAFLGCSSLYTVINCSSLTFSEGSNKYGYIAYYVRNLVNNAESSVLDDFIFYTIDGAHHLAAYTGSNTEIALPESYNGESYRIADYAFYNRNSLTAITIPESSQLKSIGKEAFYNCSSLTTITIPEGVTSIGYDAFRGCSSLLNVYCYAKQAPTIGYAFDNIRKIMLYVPKGTVDVYRSAEGWCDFGGIVPMDMEPITSIEQLSNDKIYWISQPYRNATSWAVAEGGDEMNANTDFNIQAAPDDPRQQFAIISNNDGTTRYLYHVVEKKFVNKDGSLNTWADDPIYFKDGAYENTFVAYFDDNHYVNINSVPSMVIDNWNTADGGNSCEIIPVGDFDPQEALTRLPIEKDGLVYIKIGEGELMVKSASQVSGDFTIPAIITDGGRDYTVTSIGYRAFQNCSGLTTITIPEGVKSIGDQAFLDCSSLTAINFPESIEWIGIQAFYDTPWEANLAEGLHYIGKVLYKYVGTMPENTTIEVKEGTISICWGAFEGCSNLTAITIPESVKSIGGRAFSNCSSLTAINIPEGVTSIERNTFYGCSSLTTITIPESVTSIGEYAFQYCSSLTTITIPEGVTSIERNTFYGCSSLTAITIPEGVTSIEQETFYGCSSLTAITIPESVTSIGRYAFGGCSSLTTIVIPDGVTALGVRAFYDCSDLSTVMIGNGVTEILAGTFCGCNNLEVLVVGRNMGRHDSMSIHSAFTSAPKLVISLSGRFDPSYFEVGEEEVERGIYADSASLVGDYLFYTTEKAHYLTYYMGNDTELVLPDSYKGDEYGIDASAFKDYSSLTAITIPEGVTSIGGRAFSGCTNLASINFPESIKSIGSNAFDGTAWEANLANGLHYIGKVLYKYVGEMPENTAIKVKEETTSIHEKSFEGKSGLVSIVIPESVTSIGDRAFEDCSSLTAISLPKSALREIGDYAFYGCSNLTSFDAGNTEYFGDSTFVGCNSLERVVLNCRKIEGWFNYNTSIKEVVLGDRVVGSYTRPAFSGCTNLERVTINSTDATDFFRNTSIKEVVLGDGVTMVKDNAFQNCSALTSITISKNVMTIGDPTNTRGNAVFDNCTSLKEVVFEDGSETLSLGCNLYGARRAEGLFYDCPLEEVYLGRNLNYDTSRYVGYSPFYNKGTLTSLTIGPEVTEIGEKAFSGCSAIDTITCHAMTPPTCASDAFSGVDTSIPVYVPEASVADYQAAEVWKDFLNFIGTETGIEHSEIRTQDSEVIYDLQGRRVLDTENLRGLYIVNGRKVVIK